MSVSSELVPLSNNRDVYNMMHGTELTSHNAILTAEQAKRINDNFDVEIYLGAHGATQQGDDTPHLFLRPTQREYDNAAAVVEDMQPGDTLFIEGPGFSKQPSEPLPILPDDMPPNYEGVPATFRRLTELRYRSALKKRAQRRAQLEQARQNSKISAWQYAETLAEMKGIHIVYADYDIVSRKGIQDLAQGKDVMTIATSPDPKDKIIAENMHIQRVYNARNIVKDWMLSHLPPEGTPVPEGRKPKQILLFGKWHAESLEEAFDKLGIDTKVILLESTDMADRPTEHIAHARDRALGVLMASANLSWPSTYKDIQELAGAQGSLGAHKSPLIKTYRQGGPRGFSRTSEQRKAFRDRYNSEDR